MSSIRPGMYSNNDGSLSMIVMPLDERYFDVRVIEVDEEWMATYSEQEINDEIRTNNLTWVRELTKDEKEE